MPRAAQRQPHDRLEGRLRLAAVTEGRPSLGHRVEQRAQRPQVGRRTVGVATGLLRGRVRRRAEPCGRTGARQTVPGHDHTAVVAYEHLAETQLPVDEALTMRGLQHTQDVEPDSGGPRVVERAVLVEELAQGHAVDPFDDRPQAVGLLDDVDDARHAARTQQSHDLGRMADPGDRPPDRIRHRVGHRIGRERRLRQQSRTCVLDVLAVPADAVHLVVDDLLQPVPSGDQLICSGTRVAHAHPSLKPCSQSPGIRSGPCPAFNGSAIAGTRCDGRALFRCRPRKRRGAESGRTRMAGKRYVRPPQAPRPAFPRHGATTPALRAYSTLDPGNRSRRIFRLTPNCPPAQISPTADA